MILHMMRNQLVCSMKIEKMKPNMDLTWKIVRLITSRSNERKNPNPRRAETEYAYSSSLRWSIAKFRNTCLQ